MKNKMLNKHATNALFVMTIVVLSTSCSVFKPIKAESPNTFAIEAQFSPATGGTGELTLQVSTPVARAGFESARMVYLKKAHELDHYAQNQWVDTPARMLAPLLLQALESSAKYRAVIPQRSAALADLRLDTEIVRLQHEFFEKPSRVHLTMRAQLLDMRSKSVVATREFDVVETAESDDPYGGVLATNRAVKNMLPQIAEFCVQVSKSGKPRNGLE